MDTSRLAKLQASFKTDPNDKLTRYLLALEYVKLDKHDEALEHFQYLVEKYPSYVPTYYQYAQLLEKLDRVAEAIAIYRAGLVAARHAGDSHAASELQMALDMIE